MPKNKTKIEIKKELVDFTINQIPNLFDNVPRGCVSRVAVEKFLEELKKKQ